MNEFVYKEPARSGPKAPEWMKEYVTDKMKELLSRRADAIIKQLLSENERLREALEKTREEREYWRGKATGFGPSVSVSSTD